MAIIYTYPVKATPNDNDLILISDSEDSNKTKQVKISTLPGGSGSGVSSVTAVLPLASTGGGTPAISLTGLTGFGTAGQVIKVNSGADGLEWGAAGGSTLPGGSDHSVQYKNGSAFAGGNDLTFHPTNNIFSVKHTVIVKGQGNGNPAGRLKLNCEQDSHAITLEGPAHSGGADYTLKFPSSAPGNTQILQSNNSGQLSWITTPTSGGSVSITADNTSTDYVDVQVSPSTITGAGTVMADLNAINGTSDTTTRFLSKDNTWDIPSYTAASAVTSYTNANNNYILTSSGTGVINGESSLLYNGSTLTLGTSKVFNASRSSVTSGVATAPIYVTNSTTGSGGPTNFASNVGGGAGSRHIEFYHAGTAVGSVTSTTTNIIINGESSDQRKKKNIVDWTENVLDKFALIEPKKFNFTHQNDSDPLRKGFIAQQMVDKFPEAYNHDYSISDTEGYYSFNAMGMNVYLMKAVKELKAEIDSLKSRISTLEG